MIVDQGKPNQVRNFYLPPGRGIFYPPSTMDNESTLLTSSLQQEVTKQIMANNYLLQLVMIIVLTVVLAPLSLSVMLSSKKRLPPGPRPWPILGNLTMLTKGAVHESLQRLAETYGPIYTLWMGAVPTIVVTGEVAAREALVTQGSVYASRPQYDSFKLISGNYRTLASFEYGPDFQKLRKTFSTQVLSPAKLVSYKPLRSLQAERLLQSVREEAKGACGVVQPLSSLRFATLSIMMRVLFGSQFEFSGSLKDENFVRLDKIIADNLKQASVSTVGDYVPIARMLGSSNEVHRRYKDIADRAKTLLLPAIHSRRKFLQNGVHLTESFLDVLLTLESEDSLTDQEIIWPLLELMMVGTDTTAQAVEWALAELVAHPHVQAKAYEEIQKVVGESKIVREEDLEKLPYLSAVVKEALRLHSPAAIGVPRCTTRDSKLQGYDIPAKAVVFVHLAAIGKDPKLWDAPLEFLPERFLQASESMVEDQRLKYLPFGAGRRICPGMHMASLHMNLFLANLLLNFEWGPAESGAQVDLSEVFDIVLKMKNPLQSAIRERNPDHFCG